MRLVYEPSNLYKWSVIGVFLLLSTVIAQSQADRAIPSTEIDRSNTTRLQADFEELFYGWSVDFSPISKEYALATYGRPSDQSAVVVVQLEPYSVDIVLERTNTEYLRVQYSQDGEYLAVGDELGGISLINQAQDGSLIHLDWHSQAIQDLDFDTSNCVMISTASDGVRVWQICDQDSYTIEDVLSPAALSIHPTRTNAYIITIGGVLIYDYGAHREVGRFDNVQTGLYIELSTDGTRLYVGDYEGVNIYDLSGTNLSEADLLLRIPSSRWVTSMAVSPNDEIIALGSSDTKIHLFDSISGEHLTKLDVPYGAARDVAFSPDGSYLAATTWDAALTVLYYVR
jgi:WD40 repeat protein